MRAADLGRALDITKAIKDAKERIDQMQLGVHSAGIRVSHGSGSWINAQSKETMQAIKALMIAEAEREIARLTRTANQIGLIL